MSGWDGLAWTEVLLINAALASILALLAAGIERWRPKALWLHGLWLLVILRFVAPPMMPLEILPAGWLGGDAISQGPISLETLPTMPGQASSSTYLGHDTQLLPAAALTSPSTPVPSFLSDAKEHVPAVLGGAWALMALLILTLTGRQVARLFILAKEGQSPSPAVHRLAQDLAADVGLRRMPRIRVVDDPKLASPMILSTLTGPQLLLPKALLEVLSDAELSTVLVHEWAHVQRRDHWVRWPEWLALVVFWWNPMVWWARRALRRAEERCVDERVLRLLPQGRADYARALVETAALGAGSPRNIPVLSSGIETMNSMEGRLTMILQDTSRPRHEAPSPWIRWIMWPALVCGLALLPIWGPPVSAGPGGDEGLDAGPDGPATVEVPVGTPRAEPLALDRERLEEQVQELKAHHGLKKQEVQQRLEALQARAEELAGAAESAKSLLERGQLQEQMERLESHWAMQSRSYELRLEALEAQRLRLDAAVQDGQERAAALRETYRQRAEELNALQQQQVERERQQLQQRLELLEQAGEARSAQELERRLKSRELEQKRLVHEQALRREEMALQAAQEAAEKAMHAAQQETKQRIESAMGQEKEALQAALEEERRAYQAKALAIEKERRQAHAASRAKALQAELPLRVEELRLAMDNVEDEQARQELRAELKRMHRELGELLDEE